MLPHYTAERFDALHVVAGELRSIVMERQRGIDMQVRNLLGHANH